MAKESSFSIGFCQFNAEVGNINTNVNKIITYIREAEQNGIDLLIFPELAITGYIPLDLFYNSDLKNAVAKGLEKIIHAINSGIYVILGAPVPANEVINRSDQRFYNSALVISNKGIITQINKQLLPNYGIFHEKRYFVSGISDTKSKNVVEILGKQIGIQICEDMWSSMDYYSLGEYSDRDVNISKKLVDHGAEMIINISASPYSKQKIKERLSIARNHAIINNVPFIYVNEVGAIDEVVFDGGSFAINSDGEVVFSQSLFEEGLVSFNSDQFDINSDSKFTDQLLLNKEEEILKAISINLKNYLRNINYKGKVLIALSGGVDSALTASIAVHSLGKDRVEGVYLPTSFSSNQSQSDAKEIANNLGIEFHELNIEEIRTQFASTLDNFIKNRAWSVADENLQARIRGVIMMYLSNYLGHIVLSTGNKSEIAVGYCTLYGDTTGGKNLIGDLYKTEVYALCNYINKEYAELKIPDSTLKRAPTAELKENQLDSDSLPEYEVLDRILHMLIDLTLSKNEVITFGEDPDVVKKVADLVRKNEFKRYQMVQTVRITERAFGIGRIVPVSTSFM